MQSTIDNKFKRPTILNTNKRDLKMKFETIYKKAKQKVKIEDYTRNSYGFELDLYNEFMDILTNNEYFKKCWRWNVQQNAGLTVHEGRVHIKTLLKDVFNAYFFSE